MVAIDCWVDVVGGWYHAGIVCRPLAAKSLDANTIAGITLGWFIPWPRPSYFFGFSKVARKNIARINALRGSVSAFFAFQRWTSYPLVAFMIFLGIFLRLYSSIPKPLLAILYIGIGGGLFLSSLLYYRQVKRLVEINGKD